MKTSHRLTIALACAILLMAPCYAKDSNARQPTFFSPAPDEPHIQFLASFSTDEELAELAGKRNFFRFIVVRSG